MGASISTEQCKSHYNTTVDCNVTTNGSGGFQTIAGYERGEVPPEPDIAGIGVRITATNCSFSVEELTCLQDCSRLYRCRIFRLRHWRVRRRMDRSKT